MKNKLKISEGDIICAVFRPMAKNCQQPWKIASKGEPVKIYETVTKKPHWWSKPITETILVDSTDKVYEDDMYSFEKPKDFDRYKYRYLYPRTYLHDDAHLIEKDGVWYKMAIICFKTNSIDGHSNFYNYFDSDEEALEYFKQFEDLGLAVELEFND
jgi:hypothetical protein